MLEKIRARQKSEEGFTLIELMVVVLIIAILLAIAIPTFLGARKKAQDRAAQSNLRNALTAEKTFYTDSQKYSATSSPDITDIEPNLKFDAADPKAGIVLTLNAADDTVVCLTKTSAGGQDFAIWESAKYGTWYGKTSLAGGCPNPGAAPQYAPATYVQTGW